MEWMIGWAILFVWYDLLNFTWWLFCHGIEHLHSSRFGHLLPYFLIEIEGGGTVGFNALFSSVCKSGELCPRNALRSALPLVLGSLSVMSCLPHFHWRLPSLDFLHNNRVAPLDRYAKFQKGCCHNRWKFLVHFELICKHMYNALLLNC